MRRYFPDPKHFAEAARDADVVPVYRQLLADRLTPVSAFEVLGRDSHAFLLESVVGGERIARYSFIATSPSLVYQVTQHNAVILERGQRPKEFKTTDPLADLARLLPQRRYYRDRDLPAFAGGLVGYAGYDTIRYYEPDKLTSPPADDRKLPDLLFGLYGELVIFDHVDKTIKIVANAMIDRAKGADAVEEGYRDACRRVDEIVNRLQQPPISALGEIDTHGELALKFNSNMTRQQFEDAVEKAKEYIRAGDIFQVVPSQRLRVNSSADPFDVYRARADHQSFTVHVLSEMSGVHADRIEPGDSVPGGESRGDQPAAGGDTPAQGRPTLRTRRWKRSCWLIRRSARSTSCWSICTATTSGVWQRSGR